jgi:hypothetical protein
MRDAVTRPYVFLGLSIDDPEVAVSFFVAMVTLGSVVSALLAGKETAKYSINNKNNINKNKHNNLNNK